MCVCVCGMREGECEEKRCVRVRVRVWKKVLSRNGNGPGSTTAVQLDEPSFCGGHKLSMHPMHRIP